MPQTLEDLATIDDKLSKRHTLTQGGYFIIYLDRDAGLICAKHFTNVINERGLAVDPETGKPIPVRGKVGTHTGVWWENGERNLCEF